MKNPLHYQLSEYDCGPTSMLNAISFLFEREDIPPEVIRNIMLFDPYYQTEPFPQKDILVTLEYPRKYNRVVPCSYFNREDASLYALGKTETREAVLLFNEQTKMTADKTIEYFI